MLRKVSEILFGKKATRAMGLVVPALSLEQLRVKKEKEYIAREAAVGARILGPVPSGHDREFFCLDEHTWIWHEQWRNKKGVMQQFIVNYEVDPSGILKQVNGGQYKQLTGEELRRFDAAVRLYHKEVARHVYGQQVAAV